MINKRTVKGKTSLSGIGLHTGLSTTITLCPADDHHGIKFKRVDAEGEVIIPAEVGYVVGTNRSTTLKKGDYEVTTVEHLLSALSMCGIDNVLVEIDGPEVPIMDGSASPFVDLIHQAGIQEQETEREYFVCREPISVVDERGSEILLLPSEHLEVKTMIDFNSPVLGMQYAEMEDVGDFEKEIAPSKTFVFVHEIIPLLKQKLIKGGDLNNAIVIANEEITDEQLSVLREEVPIDNEFHRSGFVNKESLKFDNEPARHKLLDVLGDIALLGRPLKGKIVATKPGHKINVEFVRALKKELVKQRKLKDKPVYDPNAAPLRTIEDIKSMLPHRYPFLLVDKIIHLEEHTVVGIKNVTGNESFFQGHFPGNPVFPGVLQMEALAQTGGILALSTVEEPHLWDTYFLKMDNVKFKSMVVPGDTVILKMELLSPIRRGIVHMQGTAYVGDRIVSEGELTAQIIKRS